MSESVRPYTPDEARREAGLHDASADRSREVHGSVEAEHFTAMEYMHRQMAATLRLYADMREREEKVLERVRDYATCEDEKPATCPERDLHATFAELASMLAPEKETR